jgi:hypothetical protein
MLQVFDQGITGGRVEGRKRFIKEKDFRSKGKGPCKTGSLRLPS